MCEHSIFQPPPDSPADDWLVALRTVQTHSTATSLVQWHPDKFHSSSGTLILFIVAKQTTFNELVTCTTVLVTIAQYSRQFTLPFN